MKFNRKYEFALLGLCFLVFNYAMSQTKEERLANVEGQISTALFSYGNHTIELDSAVAIIDVDSSIGNASIANGRITDPYGTLKGCFLFAAYDSAETGGGEAIGVFKDGSIAWLSKNIFIEAEETFGIRFWGTLDLNSHRSVDIILTGGFGIYGGRAVHESMWIFSWDGIKGRRINDVDKFGRSVIQGEGVYDSFSLYDANQSGVNVIVSSIVEELAHPSGAMSTKEGEKYCWNGKLYGICRKKINKGMN